MPRRKPPAEPAPSSPSPAPWKVHGRRWGIQIAGVLLLAGAGLGGLLWLGDLARRNLQDHERFQIPFSEIQCNPPPGIERKDFLDEVQYHSRLPDQFSILRDGLAVDLRAAFLKHPWVASVAEVELAPPRTARVVLVFREAVLTVEVAADLAANPGKPGLRGVDRGGVLLPKKAPLAPDLPILAGAPRPIGREGQPWGDRVVGTAAKSAVVLAPHWQRLKLSGMTWTAETLVIWGPRSKILWGRDDVLEASAEEKTQRLVDALVSAPASVDESSLEELDLRPQSGVKRRQLPKE
jgi:hypothetical protein